VIFHQTRDNGWVAVRRNIVPHVEDGRMSGPGFMVFCMLLLLADSDTGQVRTCASALRKVLCCGKELDERDMRRILDQLERDGYIHRARHRGKRGLYVTTIDKYPISSGPNAGTPSKIPIKIRRDNGRETPPIQQIDRRKTKTQDRSTVVGGGVEARHSEEVKEETESSFLPLDHQGLGEESAETINLSGQPEEGRPPAASHVSAAHVQDSEQAVDFSIDPGCANSSDISGDAPPPATAARQLAWYYFGLLGKPEQLRGRGVAWAKRAATLLDTYSLADVKSAAEYALNHEKFWRAKMMRFGPMDPFDYFATKLPELTEQLASAHRADRTRKPAKNSEAKHAGQETTIRKSAAELSREKSHAAGELARQAIRRRFGGADQQPD
jgi:hypothetical protein